MYTGAGRLLQGGKEVSGGEYSLDSSTADVRRGEVKLIASLGTRLASREELVLEATNLGERFDLTDVWSVGHHDKSQQDIEYRRLGGQPRTIITVKFRTATKQKNWRPSLLKAGIP